ncbi:heavy-metal-associated domain-containing protein [Allopontixanthobacter confluentis]|nr:heavy-metal-associated domain-containing protein [Allopontixanthobacter confluentis]
MTHVNLLSARLRPTLFIGAMALVILLCALVAGRALWAQVDGDRGIAAVASSSDIDIGGIEVNTTGKTAEEARQKGWAQAQRAAWKKLGGSEISDSQLESMVSAIVIEKERIGPQRYIATLGVIFDRTRAGGLLGAAGRKTRSAPMLLIPVTIEGGTARVYEMVNPWQRAWAEYQTGASSIDYVRPSGANGDSLLITYGQTSRRSRTWWRNVLDQFGAADVLIPIARLERQWPGGPIKGTFTARFGPDNRFLDSFTLTAKGDDDLPRMLNQAMLRLNGIFEQALQDGKLRPDPTLNLGAPVIAPELQQLIDLGRAADAQADAARRAASAAAAQNVPAASEEQGPATAPVAVSSYVVQFASPDGGSVDATLSAVRAAAGVRGAAASSLAIGGTSVMRVSYSGTLEQLAAALRARGFTVSQGNNALAISR